MRIAITGHRDLDEPTTHMIDTALRRLLLSALSHSDRELVGMSCLAAGADQIFARAVLALGGRLEVVVPARGYEATLTGRARPAYEELKERAHTIRVLPHPRPGPRAYLEAGLRLLNSADLLVAVWDGRAARGQGGTGEIAHRARGRVPVCVLWPEGAGRAG